MKQKLFESVSGNQFKLISENINGLTRESLVKEGVRKVFMNAGNKISYKHVQNVGLGYIKDVTDARKCAIQEARVLAKEYGFADNENTQTFVREDGEMSDYDRGEFENGRPPVSTPGHGAEEQREIQIGKEILAALNNLNAASTSGGLVAEIRKLAEELIDMHTPPAGKENW